jgi:hypothetical protein
VRKTLLLNDHSHSLIGPGQTGFALGFKLNVTPLWSTRIRYVLEAITESARLKAALARAASVPDELVDRIFVGMPASFLPSPHEGRLMRDYLLERRDCLTDVFRAHRSAFPALDGGPL